MFYHRAVLVAPCHDDEAFQRAMKHADAARGVSSAKEALEWAWITRDEFPAFFGEAASKKNLERLANMAQ